MKKENSKRGQVLRSLAATTLIVVIGLATVGCGEVVSVDGLPPGDTGPNTLALSWAAPTTNEDGSILTDLAGYKLYYGTTSGQYSQVITLGTFSSAEIGGLGSGTYYVVVTAYDIYGNESSFSNEINYTFL